MPITPFRRTVDAAFLKQHRAASGDMPPEGINKWTALRELATARTAFGLSDRDLTVLQALISFHHDTTLGVDDGDLVVYPSNKAICERLNGMPCSTMRRHVSRLVDTGFLLRRDSPNGKRYARRLGDAKLAFGFDLSPLVHRFSEISAAADDIRITQEHLQRLRTTVSLMRRDLAGLADYGQSQDPDHHLWDQLSDLARLTARDLRRKLDIAELQRIEAALRGSLDQAKIYFNLMETEDLSTKDAQSEHHHQSSNKELIDLEDGPQSVSDQGRGVGQPTPASDPEHPIKPPEIPVATEYPNIPLNLVVSTCHEYKTYSERPVRSWHDLVRVADVISPMMGIPPSAWNTAKRDIGPEGAAVVIVAMLERFTEIRSPGGYLRSLTTKAAAGTFSCGPMVMALRQKRVAVSSQL